MSRAGVVLLHEVVAIGLQRRRVVVDEGADEQLRLAVARIQHAALVGVGLAHLLKHIDGVGDEEAVALVAQGRPVAAPIGGPGSELAGQAACEQKHQKRCRK